ncbi:MAG: hypothetical protein IPG35_09675 [Flavobacteriales bacterium]|nr:hypothetical protein [Flavobacteriales bacterium]
MASVQRVRPVAVSELASRSGRQRPAITTHPVGRWAPAESMGLAALEYVSAHPAEFIALLDHDLGESDLPVWADMLSQEILIDSEEAPMEAWAERIPLNQRPWLFCRAYRSARAKEYSEIGDQRIQALHTSS